MKTRSTLIAAALCAAFAMTTAQADTIKGEGHMYEVGTDRYIGFNIGFGGSATINPNLYYCVLTGYDFMG